MEQVFVVLVQLRDKPHIVVPMGAFSRQKDATEYIAKKKALPYWNIYNLWCEMINFYP